jgi:hypothetical protein
MINYATNAMKYTHFTDEKLSFNKYNSNRLKKQKQKLNAQFLHIWVSGVG